MRLRTLILTLAVIRRRPLLAQTPQTPAPPVFRAGTDLVEVDVITRDKSGLFVSDLALDDFELREDGKLYPGQQVYLRRRRSDGWGDTLAPAASRGCARERAIPTPAAASSSSSSTMRI